MKKNILMCAISLFLTAIVGACSSDEPSAGGDKPTICPGNTTLVLTDAESRAAAGMQDFNIDFFKAVVAEEAADKNVVCSPLSASILLSMLANVADETAKAEIVAALGSKDIEALNSLSGKYLEVLPLIDNSAKLGLANSVWYQKSYTLNKSFEQTSKDYFGTDCFAVDFRNDAASAKQQINNWVKDKTEGLISEIINNVNSQLIAVMVNALYFKGQWTNPFDAAKTEKKEFHGLDRTSTVDMMHNDGLQHYTGEADFQAVKMEFGNGAYAATLILPNEGIDINEFIYGDALKTAMSARFIDHDVELSFPRFSIEPETDISLTKPLESLGITSLSNTQNISLFGEDVKESLQLKQKATVEFTEQGAEGAAVTWGEWYGSNGENKIPQMNFNRPFVFLINETTTGVTLFAGKVAQL